MTLALSMLAVGSLVGLCLAASYRDVKTGRIPNRLTYGFAFAGLLFWTLGPPFAELLNPGETQRTADLAIAGFSAAAQGLLAALIPAVIVVLLGGLGGGDMKLLAACGAWLASPMAVLDMAVVALVAAAAMAIAIMIKKRIVKRTLAGVLGVGFMLASRLKPDLAERATGVGGNTVPFAVAVTVGALCAAAEHLLGFPLPWSHW